MQRHSWSFLAVLAAAVCVQGVPASANNQQGAVSSNYDGKKELPQISANPRKPQAANPGANSEDKKTSKPRSTTPEEPEINIGGWDRGGEIPKTKKEQEPDPTILLSDEASSETKPATDKASKKSGAENSPEKPAESKTSGETAVKNSSPRADNKTAATKTSQKPTNHAPDSSTPKNPKGK